MVAASEWLTALSASSAEMRSLVGRFFTDQSPPAEPSPAAASASAAGSSAGEGASILDLLMRGEAEIEVSIREGVHLEIARCT